MKYFKSEWIFLYAVLLIGLFILNKTVHFPVSGDIKLTIIEHKGAITSIDTKKSTNTKKEFEVDTLHFLQGRILEHKSLGILGYKTNFFIHAQTQMDVAKAGLYNFYVASDDGFRLKIDGKTLCEHPKDRPMKTTTCQIDLSSGKHRFDLLYFQGGGPMALKVLYKKKDTKKSYFVGDSTDFITFSKDMK